MSQTTRQKLGRRKRRIEKRLSPGRRLPGSGPVVSGSNIHYDVADRAVATGVGGIGSLHLLDRQVGLVEAIDSSLHLLKVHLPYHESDHVLNIAYNVMCGGDCLQDIEQLRNDEANLNGLGAERVRLD